MPTTDRKQTIECRPDGQMWIPTAIGFAMGLLFFGIPVVAFLHHARDLSPLILASGILGMAGFWLGLYGLLFLMRARVIADKHQLRWRGALGWRSASWEEVRDYYEQAFSKGRMCSTIETDAGKIVMGTTSWSHANELRELVCERARQARAKEWGKQSYRIDGDWCRIFTYNERTNRGWLWGLSTALGFMLICPFLIWASKFPEKRFGPGWWSRCSPKRDRLRSF